MVSTGRKVVAPGEIVASTWGNLVWDQSIQQFENAADRDAQFPAPKAGALVYLADTGTYWRKFPAGWGRLGPVGGIASINLPTGGVTANVVTTFAAGVFGGGAPTQVVATMVADARFVLSVDSLTTASCRIWIRPLSDIGAVPGLQMYYLAHRN